MRSEQTKPNQMKNITLFFHGQRELHFLNFEKYLLHNPLSFTLIWILACIENIHACVQNSITQNLLSLTHHTACCEDELHYTV